MPRCACCSLPILSRKAPVKLPLTCPKSSDSSSVSEKLAQLRATKRCAARSEREWTTRARMSFPTPLSPVMRTFARPSAIRVATAITRAQAALSPMTMGVSE